MKVILFIWCFIVSINILNAQTNVFPSSGNVGIGTTSPVYPLHVDAADQTYILIRAANYTANPGQLVKKGGIIFNQENSDKTAGISFAIPPGYHVPGILFSTKTYYDNPGPGGTDWYDRMFIHPSGNVGIGTTNPQSSLQIGNFSTSNSNAIVIPGAYNFEQVKLGQISNGNSALEFVNHVSTSASYGVRLMASIDEGGPGLQFQYTDYQNSYGALNYKTGMFMSLNGKVGIGTTTPNEKLAVNGNIRAKEIKVESANWPDYVFKPSYKLMPLPQIENFIKQNGHLPDMPTAKEVAEKGIEVGASQAVLLKKIEELTLHLIEMEKKNERQNRRIKKLENRISKDKLKQN